MIKNRKGITLIEMLIIVACIAALIAIGYPQFANMMEQNRENTDIIAMQSAKVLLETAINTGLQIEGKPASNAVATRPLYYTPGGKLTWTQPEAYGEGTKGSTGITWSCCSDYAYNPESDYRSDVVYCYVNPVKGELHVHWTANGSTGNTPAPVPPVPTTTFPTVPKQEAETTEPTGENPPDIPDTPVTPPIVDDKPGGSDKFQDPIFRTMKSHAFPFTDEKWQTSGYRLHVGHVYRYTDQEGEEHVYVSLYTDNGNQTYKPETGGHPLPGGNLEWNVVEPNGIVLTQTGDENGNFKLESGKTKVTYGTIFKNDTGDYYIFKAGQSPDGHETVIPEGEGDGNWVKINLNCPDKCGADVNH